MQVVKVKNIKKIQKFFKIPGFYGRYTNSQTFCRLPVQGLLTANFIIIRGEAVKKPIGADGTHYAASLIIV